MRLEAFGSPIEAVVVAAEDGEALNGALVSFLPAPGGVPIHGLAGLIFPFATDARGRVLWPDAPAGEWAITAAARDRGARSVCFSSSHGAEHAVVELALPAEPVLARDR